MLPTNSSLSFFSRRNGYTIIELLTVVVIASILGVLLTTAVTRAQQSARNAACQGNLRQLFTAASFWAMDNGNRMPDSRHWGYSAISTDMGSWSIAPYLGLKREVLSPKTTFTCPAANALSRSKRTYSNTYSMSKYAGGTFNTLPLNITITATPSQRALFIDGIIGQPGEYWSYAEEIYMTAGVSPGEQFPHQGKMNVVYADGHVSSFTKEYANTCLTKDRSFVPFWGGTGPE